MSLSDGPDVWVLPLEEKNLGKRSAQGFFITLIAQGMKTLLTAISAVVLSRLLMAADFGLLASVTPLTSFLALLSNVGLFQSVVQSKNISQRQLMSLFYISVGIGIGFALLFLLATPGLAWAYHDQRVMLVAIALSSTIFISSLSSLPIAVLSRVMAFRKIAIIEVISVFTTTFFSIGLAIAGRSYWALVCGQIAGVIVTLGLAWVLSPWQPSGLRFSLSGIRSMLVFGRNLTITNMAFYLNASVDNMIVGYRSGESALGLYDRAWKLAVMPLNQLITPIDRIALPALSRLLGNPSGYRQYFTRMLELTLLLTGPGLMVVIFSAPFLVPELLGERWRDMTPIFQWLCVGGLLSPINGATYWLFVSQARSKDQIPFTLGAIAINIAAYFIGSRWGVEGVVRTSALSVYIFQAPLLVYGACLRGPVRLRDFLDGIKAPLLSMVTVAISLAIFWNWAMPVLNMWVIAYLFGQAYLVGIIALFLTGNGRTLIQQTYQLLTVFARRLHPPLLN